MLGLFKKKTRKAVIEVKKMENRVGRVHDLLCRWHMRRKRNCHS